MSKTGVERAIQRVRLQTKIYDRYDDYYWSYNETSTRYILIDPVLKALGWDINDMDQCGVEWPMPWQKPIGRADYVLANSKNKTVIVIEAKSIKVPIGGRRRGFENKLASYAKGIDTGVAVLTNGQLWHLYELDSSRRALKNKHVAKADLREGYGSISESAQILNEWLDKDRWW